MFRVTCRPETASWKLRGRWLSGCAMSVAEWQVAHWSRPGPVWWHRWQSAAERTRSAPCRKRLE